MRYQKALSLISVVVGAAALLTGCSDRVVLADEQMQAIRSQPAQPIKPPPVPEKIEDFTYDPGQTRSPFMPLSLMAQANQVGQIKGVQPDKLRIKQPLEEFELSQLLYKGIIISSSGEKSGLIQMPTGRVLPVKVGNYMGKNYGRIVEITPTKINLIEIVPDARVGYVEKPNTIATPAS